MPRLTTRSLTVGFLGAVAAAAFSWSAALAAPAPDQPGRTQQLTSLDPCAMSTNNCGPLLIQLDGVQRPGSVVLTWGDGCQLQETASLDVPVWMNVAGSSPLLVPAPLVPSGNPSDPSAGKRFFRTLSANGSCSPNIVGYVNLTLAGGMRYLIANPLNGTNNHLDTLLPLPNSADGTVITRFDPTTQSESAPITWFSPGWSTPNGSLFMAPGEGFFITMEGNHTVTFVGDVSQGYLVNSLPAGVSYQSSIAALDGRVGGVPFLNFPADDGDQILVFDPATQNFQDPYSYIAGFGWFSPTDPDPEGPFLPVGTGFIFQNAGPVKNWIQLFGPSDCAPSSCLVCAPDKTVECGAPWTFEPPDAGACCGSNVTVLLISTVTNGTCPQIVTRAWQTIDCCGNANPCLQRVTVVDTTPPVITCAADKTVECGDLWDFDPPSATDACCGVGVTILTLGTATNGICPQEVARTWQATDCCGNTNICRQTVTVVDIIPPLFPCASPEHNLVPNPGFENFVSCPSAFGQTHLASPWFQPTLGTSDFFHTCASASQVQVPNNFLGVQLPQSGEAYGGVIAYAPELPGNPEYREYLEAPLLGSLVAGRTYEVSFYVSLAEVSPYALDNLGAHFSVGPILNDATFDALPLTPQVRNPAGTFLSSTNDWMLIEGTFTASGGENYITIGNFYNNANTPARTNSPSDIPYTYYYVDQVTVRERCASADKIVPDGDSWTFDVPTVLDTCCSPTLSVLSTVTNGVCPQEVTRTWQATDCCGNTAAWSQTVTLLDNTPPDIMGCLNISTNSLPGTNGNHAAFSIVALDNSAGSVPVHCAPPSGSFFPTGDTPVVCAAADPCGNTNTCAFTVTVRPLDCLALTHEVILCVSNAPGAFTYRFDLKNLTEDVVKYVVLPADPACLGIDPEILILEPPLAPGETRPLSVLLTPSGSCSTNVCFPISLHSPTFAQCCAVEQCLPLVVAPPTLQGCQNIQAQAADGQTNAVVVYTVTATNTSLVATVACTPPSGASFSLGVTPVICVATDACGLTNACQFTVTVDGSQGDLFVEDTPYDYDGAPDLGREPDPDMIGQNMWLSRAIWVHQDCSQPAGTFLTHQNPRFGQANCVFVKVSNRGSSALSGAPLKVYYANASVSLTWPAGWTLLGAVSLPSLDPGASHVAQLTWPPPGTGHYCLLARIDSLTDPMAMEETASVRTNARANNNIAWRNVNVEDLLRTPARKVEVRTHNPAPMPKTITFVFNAGEGFLDTGGEALLDLGPLLARWQAGGMPGTNAAVTNGTQIRFTGSPARVEGIPLARNEERIFNLTVRANDPMPMPGTNHVYHVGLLQEVDGEIVGGVNYTVVTRAQDTDTDGDGVRDVLDPDDDGDGVPDGADPDPLGERDCEPSALTITRLGDDLVLTWSGLGYRLQATSVLGQPWTELMDAASPAVVLPEAQQRFFRLICP